MEKHNIEYDDVEDILMSDEDLAKRIANQFIHTEKLGGYTLFEEMNDRWRNGETPKNSDRMRVLWNRWECKWLRYLKSPRRIKLAYMITDKVCTRYYKRYKKDKNL